MHNRRLRWLAPLALVCALVVPATAGATTKYDTSYANGGMLLLPAIKGLYGQVAKSCAIADDRLHVAGEFGWLTPSPVLATTAVKLHAHQAMTLGVANVRWTKQRVPTDHAVVSEAFDGDGGFAYATRPYASSKSTRLMLFRITKTGRRAAKFGRNGYIRVTIPRSTSANPLYLRVIALPAGRVFLLTQNNDGQTIRRFTSRGKPDGKWGRGGEIKLATPNAFSGAPLGTLASATATGDEGLLISASGTPSAPSPGALGVIKLTKRGVVDTGWGDGGLWTAPTPTGNFNVTGRSLLTAARGKNNFVVLFADATEGPLGISSELKLVRLDARGQSAGGLPQSVGTYYNGGDTGFPSTEPWSLTNLARGPVFAYAASYYGSPGGSFRGSVSQVLAKTGAPIKRTIDNSGFAIGDFAADPTQPYLYSCGSFGVTSSRAKDLAKRSQRKNVAIKRIKL